MNNSVLPTMGVPRPDLANSGLIDMILEAGTVLDERNQNVSAEEHRLYVVPPHIADLIRRNPSEENQ